MKVVNISEAKAKLAELLRKLQAGERIVIARRNKPVAELRPLTAPAGQKRPHALCRGEFSVPEDFNEPLPEELIRDFEGR